MRNFCILKVFPLMMKNPQYASGYICRRLLWINYCVSQINRKSILQVWICSILKQMQYRFEATFETLSRYKEQEFAVIMSKYFGDSIEKEAQFKITVVKSCKIVHYH